jgi:hypothetical protein
MPFRRGTPDRTRIVDQNVDLAIPIEDGIHQVFGGTGTPLAQIVHDRQNFDFFDRQSRRCGVQLRLPAGADRKLRSHLAERFGHLKTQTPRSSSNQGNFSAQVEQAVDVHRFLGFLRL